MDKYDAIISLGYTCNVVSLLYTLGYKNEAYLFDRIGTPMWAISQLFNDNFKNFLKYENMKCEPLFENSNNKYIFDNKYYIRLTTNSQELTEKNHFMAFRQTLLKRKDRLLEKLHKSKKVLFIRCQEPNSYTDLGNRIIPAHFDKMYQKDEHYYLKKFSNIIKKQFPKLHFKIIYMSELNYFIDNESNIIGIPLPDCDYRDIYISKKMSEHWNLHSEYIFTYI